MTHPERRTVAEIAALHRLEPGIATLYVEGAADACFWRSMLGTLRPVSQFAVSEIDAVDIPAKILLDNGIPDSRRGRVIWLAVSADQAAVTGIVGLADSDFDALFGHSWQSKSLVYTHYSSTEMFASLPVVISKFFTVVAHLDAAAYAAVFEILSGVLRTLFLIRAANVSLGWNMSWLSPRKSLARDEMRVLFDEDDFLTKYLSANRRIADRVAFIEELKRLQKLVIGEHRCAIRAGDFFELLAWYLRSEVTRDRRDLCDPRLLGPTMMGAVDAAVVQESADWKQISRRLDRKAA